MKTELLTNHGVDNDVMDYGPMSLFRQNFLKMAPTWISQDGRLMTYALQDKTRALEVEMAANRLIQALRLPLEAYLATYQANRIVTCIDLEVKMIA